MAVPTAPPAIRARSTKSAQCTAPPIISRERLEELHAAGAGYVLINGGGSGGGARGRTSLRRFAREVMPHFVEAPVKRVAV